MAPSSASESLMSEAELDEAIQEVGKIASHLYHGSGKDSCYQLVRGYLMGLEAAKIIMLWTMIYQNTSIIPGGVEMRINIHLHFGPKPEDFREYFIFL